MCSYPEFLKKELIGRFESYYADEWREEFSEIELASPLGMKIERKLEKKGFQLTEDVDETEQENENGEDAEMKSGEFEGDSEGSAKADEISRKAESKEEEPKEEKPKEEKPKAGEPKSEPVEISKEKALSLLDLSHDALSGTLEFSEIDAMDFQKLHKIRSAASLSVQLSDSVAEYISSVPLRIKVTSSFDGNSLYSSLFPHSFPLHIS